MTEPDEALLWARVEYATLIRPFDVGPEQDYISEVILNGLWDDDVSIRHGARGYRAGVAASAERIKALEDALREAADDLEAEIKARAEGDLPRRVERDLEPVFRARATLAKYRGEA